MVHRHVQSEQDSTYYPEYPLETFFTSGSLTLDIQGRADGLIKGPDGFTVDEIKSTVAPLSAFKEANFPWHQGQAKMYAWMFCRENKIGEMTVRMTYVRQHHEEERLIQEDHFSFDDLDAFAHQTIAQYLKILFFKLDHIGNRNKSLSAMEFPFPEFRPGQKDLMAFCDKIAMEGSTGYIEAPTGIGKTVCVLYSALKSLLGEDGPEKIYYLTSKTSIKRQALLTARIMAEKGADIRVVVLTSKDNFALDVPGYTRQCNPDECPYDVGYYDKVKKVIREAFATKSIFDEKDFVYLAKKYTICPFQLQLDMAGLADIVICDYNYVYDPVVGIPALTKDVGKVDYGLLVDEAHNLPERARDMYSAEISLGEIDRVSAAIQGKEFSHVNAILERLKDFFRGQKNTGAGNVQVLSEIPSEIIGLLKLFGSTGNDLEKSRPLKAPDEYVTLKSEFKALLSLPLSGADNFIYYYVFGQKGFAVSLEIRCLDASAQIKSITSRLSYGLFFSATLSPKDYYIKLLGGTVSPDGVISLPSPFESGNRLVLVDDKISTTYSSREATLKSVCNSLYALASARTGNYFFFFPSFDYMEKAYAMFASLTDIDCLKQEKHMDPLSRDAFIESFGPNPERTRIGFAVLGGVFGEGIELLNHALSGVAIVSVGLPGIGFENELLRSYYDKKGVSGFDFAYTYPGFNRVVQAAGRLIRDQNDHGTVLLVDRRFGYPKYKELLKDSFPQAQYVSSPSQIRQLCDGFWKAS